MLARVTHHFLMMCWNVHPIFLIFFATLVIGAGVIAMLENMPFQEALYFSFITGLTIGYGDITPHTPVGRIVSVALGIAGILFSGLVVAITVRAVQNAYEELNSPD